MPRRQLLPLALAYADNQEPVHGRTRLQKMVFLMQQELEDEGFDLTGRNQYQFMAYDYGPFSKTLYDDIDRLKDQHLIHENEEEFDGDKVIYEYKIEQDGIQSLEERLTDDQVQQLVEKAQEIKEQFNEMPLQKLIDKVYSQYPNYAKNSQF